MVKVFKYSVYDGQNDMMVPSHRMATLSFIDGLAKAQIDEATGVEIDEKYVDSNGQTEVDFDPRNPDGTAGGQKV